MRKNILIALLLGSQLVSFSQNDKKMQKHLTVSVTGNFDSKSPVMFDRQNPQKHGWDKTLQNFNTAFLSSGFNVIDQSSAKNVTTGFKLVMDYDYGYVISQYKMQYSNLRGQIIDLSNNSSIIGTFDYDGKFDLDDVSKAIAIKLKAIAGQSPYLQKTTPVKTKEDKLKELKDLFDKKLITQEDYDRERKRVLEEL